MCSVAGRVRPAIWDSSTSGFHRLSATKPVCSLKGEVKKKHNSKGWIFSCFAAHLFEQDLF